jgi:hypothetical protein
MTLPTVIEVTRLVDLIQGPAPRGTGRDVYRQRYEKTRRWLTAQRVRVAAIGQRRVVYLADLRETWPELWESAMLAARARAEREPCERCGVMPSCDCPAI